MKRRAPIASFFVVAASLLSSAGALRAEERTPHQLEARAHFQRAVDFFKENDYRAALIEFKRAYEISPNYRVLYNLGQTSLELQDYASALHSFERYLTEGGKEVPAARRTQVEADIEKLKKRVARIEITTNVADAEIFVDDVSVGRSPLTAPVPVSAGRRKISAAKGGLTSTRTVDLAGGDSTSVSLEIVQPASGSAAVPAPPPRPTEPARPKASETATSTGLFTTTNVPATPKASGSSAVWIGITATGVLAAGSVATGIFALRSKRDFDDKVARYGVEPQAIDDARSKTKTLALVTDILAGAAIVSGGITIVAAVAGGGSSKEQTKAALGVGPGGVWVNGTF